jgi:hypothetical protein
LVPREKPKEQRIEDAAEESQKDVDDDPDASDGSSAPELERSHAQSLSL